jgi:glycosyltransferase involved in cell wall biosynthesis
MQPTISICIPTFNRSICLENLLKNILIIKTAHGTDIEICISNNQSTDTTQQVIEAWRQKLMLKTVTQPTNIGASKNVIEVTRLATGKWILLIGDDDEFIATGIESLLAFIHTADENDWILAGVANESGNEHLLGDLKHGLYEAKRFRRVLLRTGLYRFGFIGMHIFPAALCQQFVALSFQEAQSWPHIALFLRCLKRGRVRVFPDSVVKQCGGGNELYWNPGDWVRINLGKINIIAEARKIISNMRCFFYLLMFRELYSTRCIKSLIMWKILEPIDFRQKAFREFFSRYLLLGPFVLVATLHCVFLVLVFSTPSIIFHLIFHLAGKQDLLERHLHQKKKLGNFDGVKRGL